MPPVILHSGESFNAYRENDFTDVQSSKLPLIDLYLSTVIGNGITFSRGYTTVGILASKNYQFQDNFFFIDGRTHIFANGKSAANIGIGNRFFSKDQRTSWGLNAFYDYRQSHKSFHQLGVGLEFFENCFDISVNAYLPIHNVREKAGERIFNFGDRFKGRCTKSKKALWGADFDISTNLRKWFLCGEWDVYAAGGIYFFAKYRCQDLRGIKMRFGFQYSKYISLECRTTYDNIFHSRIQGVILLSYPFGCPYSYPAYRNRETQRVQRQEIIILGKRSKWEDNW